MNEVRVKQRRKNMKREYREAEILKTQRLNVSSEVCAKSNRNKIMLLRVKLKTAGGERKQK